jgi:pyruvate formate lyase activating enzyme
MSERRTPKVGGVTPFTATDFPGKLAAVVFMQGCPWRCGYCHNPHLQPRRGDGAVPWPQVMDLLRRRAGLIDAVVFSGGEPTLDPMLGDAISEVRGLGFEVGLHTAGAYPKRLAALLPLLDWVGIDVKAPFDRYASVTGIANSGRHARASAEAVLASGVAHEFRTTLHPALLEENEIFELAKMLAKMGAKNYALQIFRTIGCVNDGLNSVATIGYPGADLLGRVSGLFPQFTLRRE